MKAIITDIDGTLLPSGEKNISPANKAALIKAGEEGIVRIVATGRSLFSFQRIFDESLPIDYLVFSSGAGIFRWHDQQILHKKHLSNRDVREIFSLLSSYQINFTVQKEIPENHRFYYTDYALSNADFQRRLNNYTEGNTRIESAEEITTDATQFLMILRPDQLELFKEIEARLPDFSVIRSTSPIDEESIWVEIFHSDVHKGTGCNTLLRSLHINWDETAGLGNDYNDIDFLELTPRPFVVANAPEELKRRYLTVRSDREDGFADFFDQVLHD